MFCKGLCCMFCSQTNSSVYYSNKKGCARSVNLLGFSPCPFGYMHIYDKRTCKCSAAFAQPGSGTWQANQQLQQDPTHAAMLDRLRAEKLPWTELMHRAMAAAHEEHGASAADVQAACAKVPMHPHMQEASESLVTSVLFLPLAACMHCICIVFSKVQCLPVC